MKKILPFIIALLSTPVTFPSNRANSFSNLMSRELAPKDGTLVVNRALLKNDLVKPLKTGKYMAYAYSYKTGINPLNIYK